MSSLPDLRDGQPDRPLRLLFVHAHPDDESLWTGITIAHHVQAGDEVHVLTCTLGEEGEVIPAELAHLEGADGDPLGDYRRGELAGALTTLGAIGHLLGDGAYRDSGMVGSPASAHPRALAGAPLADVAAAVGRVIDEIEPDIVVTYDATGGYGHPDHVRVHDAVKLATTQHPGPALYAIVTPQTRAQANRDWVTAHRPDGDWIIPGEHTAYASSVVADDRVTHEVVDQRAASARDLALRAHATQVYVGSGWYALSDRVVYRLDDRESFVALGESDQEPVVDAANFRAAMGRFPTGVCVLTTLSDGSDHAMTADTLTSVSLDPLLILVCVQRGTRFREAVLASGSFAVSVLAADQEELSVWFATRGRPLAEQLAKAPHHRGNHTGAALLDGALAHLECTTSTTVEAGDHTIVIAQVESIGLAGPDRPALVHHRGSYGSVT